MEYDELLDWKKLLAWNNSHITRLLSDRLRWIEWLGNHTSHPVFQKYLIGEEIPDRDLMETWLDLGLIEASYDAGYVAIITFMREVLAAVGTREKEIARKAKLQKIAELKQQLAKLDAEGE